MTISKINYTRKSLIKKRVKNNKNKNLTKKKHRKHRSQKGGLNPNQEQPPNNLTAYNEVLNNQPQGEVDREGEGIEAGENVEEGEVTNERKGALVGSYNHPDKGKSATLLDKAIQEERGGLFISYPPIMDMDKTVALDLKEKDLREPGFSTYRGEIADKIEPKFSIKTFYPKYLSYYELQPGYIESETNNSNMATETNNLGELNNNNFA
jgi:hypothetical protein